MPFLSPGQLVHHRSTRHAENDYSLVHERDLGRKERVLAHKSLRAVDRIDQPQVVGILTRAAGFLAKKSVFGELLKDDLANFLFALDVGLGYGRQISLGCYCEVSSIVAPTDVRRSASRFQCRQQFL